MRLQSCQRGGGDARTNTRAASAVAKLTKAGEEGPSAVLSGARGAHTLNKPKQNKPGFGGDTLNVQALKKKRSDFSWPETPLVACDFQNWF